MLEENLSNSNEFYFPIQVLHVDDEIHFLQTSKAILEMNNGIEVTTAHSVKKAIDLINSQDFDVIISDYQMPEKDGLQFLKELRKKGSSTPFILFTGKGREEVAIKALNLGADRYFNKIGKPETVYGELAHTLKEVVKREREKAALIESEEKFRLICESSEDLIAITDFNAKPLWANRAWVNKFGKVSEFNIDPLEMVHPEDKDRIRKVFTEFLSGDKKRAYFEHKYLLVSGECLDIQSLVSKLEINKTCLLVVVAKDVTQQKTNEKRLKDSEERFRTYIENSPTAVFVANQKAEYEYVNEAASKLLGYSKKELLTMSIPHTLFGSGRKRIPGFAKLIKDGSFRAEVKLKHKNGEPVYIKLNAVKLPNGRLIGFCENVTKRMQVEKQLMLSELLYRMQFEEALDAIFLADAETGIIINCNEAATKLADRKKPELIGKHQRILHPPTKIHVGFSKTFKEFLDGKEGQILEDQVITKSGEIKDVEIKANILRYANKKIIQGIFRDITKKKIAYTNLLDHRKFLDAIFEQNPYPMWISDENGTLIKINEALLKMLKLKRSDVENKYNVLKDSQVIAQGLLPQIKEAFNGKTVTFRLDYDTAEVKQLALSDKSSRKQLETTITPVLDQNKKLRNLICVHRDVTKEIEFQNKLNDSFEELALVNEKLGVVGKFVRHDVRNKLASIANNIYLAKQNLQVDSKSVEFLEKTEKAFDEIDRIFNFAHAYEQLGIEELTEVDVGQSFDEAGTLHGELDEIIVENKCKGVKVKADSLLRTLFYNLIDNSLRHGKKVTKISLACRSNKNNLFLVYEDNGLGIPEKEKNMIFKSDFGKGTGMGLSLIKAMCKFYGWTISETGTEGKGAKFLISIPKGKQLRNMLCAENDKAVPHLMMSQVF